MRFCSSILEDETSRRNKETLNAACLLFIDDVARVAGLCVLHAKITDSLQHIDRLYLDLRLSPNIFAQYLTVTSVERISNILIFIMISQIVHFDWTSI